MNVSDSDDGILGLGSSEWRERQTGRLLCNPKAQQRLLAVFGISNQIVERYHLGLTPPAKGREYADALVVPIINRDHSISSHCVYYNIPGVTTWASGIQVRDCWGPRPPRLYCSTLGNGFSTLLVLPTPCDIWALAQLLSKRPPQISDDITAIASSHGAM